MSAVLRRLAGTAAVAAQAVLAPVPAAAVPDPQPPLSAPDTRPPVTAPGEQFSVARLLTDLQRLYRQTEQATETYNATTEKLQRQRAEVARLDAELARSRLALRSRRLDAGRLARQQYQQGAASDPTSASSSPPIRRPRWTRGTSSASWRANGPVRWPG